MTMQRQEHLPNNHTNHHKDMDIYVQDASCKSHWNMKNSLHNPELEDHLLKHSDKSVLLKDELMYLSLPVSFCFGEAPDGLETISKLPQITCGSYVDFNLLSIQATDLKVYRV